MRLGALGLVYAFLIAGCRPIDEVVARTSQPPNSVTPIATVAPSVTRPAVDFVMQEYPVTRGQGPHDVAPARDALAVAAATLGWRWRTRIPGGTPTS